MNMILFGLILVASHIISASGQNITKTQLTAGGAQLSPTCYEKLFPISAGGSSDETVLCTLYDSTTGYIFVVGETESDDFGPAQNKHAFVYAVDVDANWKWGNFYYNVSYNVETLSGCQINGNNQLLVLGLSNKRPIVMEIDPATGAVTNFVQISGKVEAADKAVTYTTYGAVYHDVSDPYDN